MSIIKKIVCDGCGKEITGDPYRVKIVQQDPETDDIADKYAYENNAEDFCADCKVRIVDFLYKLTAWRLQEEEEKELSLCQKEPDPGKVKADAGRTAKIDWAELKKLAPEMTQRELAEHFGVSASGMYRYLKQNDIVAKKGRRGRQAGTTAESNGERKQAAVINKEFDSAADQMIIDGCVGKNADRHKCRSCKYRSKVGGKQICDYCSIVGHTRGCEVKDCSVFEKGSPVSKRKTKDFYES
ncbi:hypothetical protein [Hespellia stercorisuis]|uniref:Uncharacterized protein n=1 Tax=Hespellia stercorisuis DSM 15480 TaxID=1121950 RepID=A0A1M6REN8_9FIRM|nr:hypothetical protein [Hespellia stercorisuis]SHK30919.1 hypothetical protein SAMN02745243_02670 [Hespellia stercorisuis DSM 15480]